MSRKINTKFTYNVSSWYSVGGRCDAVLFFEGVKVGTFKADSARMTPAVNHELNLFWDEDAGELVLQKLNNNFSEMSSLEVAGFVAEKILKKCAMVQE